MIDRTSGRIVRQLSALRRAKRRRYAFQRLLAATDRVLWRLEEMNRDGVKATSRPVRQQIRELAQILPEDIGKALRDEGQVQATLDSLFDVQERLFRWRYPDWHDFDPEEDGFEFAAG